MCQKQAPDGLIQDQIYATGSGKHSQPQRQRAFENRDTLPQQGHTRAMAHVSTPTSHNVPIHDFTGQERGERGRQKGVRSSCMQPLLSPQSSQPCTPPCVALLNRHTHAARAAPRLDQRLSAVSQRVSCLLSVTQEPLLVTGAIN